MSQRTMLSLVTLSVAALALAQVPRTRKPPGNLTGNFTFIPKADVERVQQAIETGRPNALVRMLNISNRSNLGVYTLNSPPSQAPGPGAPVMGFYHNDIAEVYIVVSGAGTWRVGGELENPKVDDVKGV
jgi:hypothetical protein